MGDVLINKQRRTYTYTSRYSKFPFYYNTVDGKYIYGLTGQLDLETDYVLHTVAPGDTLDSLAFQYYGRPDFFWIIADFNRIKDSLGVLYNKYSTIKVPNMTRLNFSEMV